MDQTSFTTASPQSGNMYYITNVGHFTFLDNTSPLRVWNGGLSVDEIVSKDSSTKPKPSLRWLLHTADPNFTSFFLINLKTVQPGFLFTEGDSVQIWEEYSNTALDLLSDKFKWKFIKCPHQNGCFYIVNSAENKFLDTQGNDIAVWNSNGRDIPTIINGNTSQYAKNIRWYLIGCAITFQVNFPLTTQKSHQPEYFSVDAYSLVKKHLEDIITKKTEKTRFTLFKSLKEELDELNLKKDSNILGMIMPKLNFKEFNIDDYSTLFQKYFPLIPILQQPATNNNIRILDTPPSSNLRFSPIYGIADINATSLMEAISPLVTNHLVKHIDKYTQDALDLFSEKPLPTTTLNLDETVAIHLYTKEWPVNTHSLYYILNAQLRSKDRSLIKPFFPYIKILLNGLTKLDKTPGISYRGVKLNLSNDFTIGDKIQWWSFTSTTINGNACQKFLEKSPEKTLFRLEQRSGVNIQKFSEYPDESEILLWPMTLLVKNKFMVVKELCIVELEEIGNPLVNL